MAYECVMCPDGERARFVFIDTEDGQTAASCEGHVFDFLMAMTAYAAQALGVEVTSEDLGINGSEPATEPKAHKTRTRKPKEAADNAPEPDETPPESTEDPEPVTAE